MTDLTPLIDHLAQYARAGSLTFGDALAMCLTGTETTIHHLPAEVLDHPARLHGLIGTPDETLIMLIADPADLPRELRRWEMTRTRIATNGMWLLDPVITDLKRWWQLPAGQSGLTGPGTPLNTEPQTPPAERRQE